MNRESSRRILQHRARQLSRRPTQRQTEDLLELLEFRLAQERYSVETRYVREVHPLRDMTPLPGTPPFVLGIVNLRGRIVPVYDLKKFFGLPEKGLTDLHRVILVGNEELELGILADVVEEVRSVASSSLQVSISTLTGIRADYLQGVTEERMVVLDLARILADPRIVVQQKAEN